MSTGDVDELLARLHRTRSPAELFGSDPDQAARAYHRMARLLHPDTTPGGAGGMGGDGGHGRTVAAFAALTELWRTYSTGERDRDGASDGVELTIATRRHSYGVGARRARGDLADLYPVTIRSARGSGPYDSGPHHSRPLTSGLLKLPRDPACNDLVEREAVALRQLPKDGPRRFLPYVPRLIETFRHRDAATGQRRTANVITVAEGFFSLAEVRAAYPDGVDPRDAAWMWRRLLVALGFAHRAGVLHGAVLPEHVLIHPGEHGLVLVDWCYSVPGCYAATDPSGRVPAMVTRYADWYPHEVPGRLPASPATDLAMAARCLLYLMEERAPREMRRFARGCLLPAQNRRPSDAWRLLREFDEVLERLYGPRRFRPFTMPSPPGGAGLTH